MLSLLNPLDSITYRATFLGWVCELLRLVTAVLTINVCFLFIVLLFLIFIIGFYDRCFLFVQIYWGHKGQQIGTLANLIFDLSETFSYPSTRFSLQRTRITHHEGV